MSRAQRLLELLQLLRRHRYPVSGAALAESLGISLRTLYRDIGALQQQGAKIDGEAGVGYVLRPGYTLPPLMFSEDEIEAIALGIQWVMRNGDNDLSDSARDVMAKITAVLPENLRDNLHFSPNIIGPGKGAENGCVDLAALRALIKQGRKIQIGYRDGNAKKTQRTVWPFALGYIDDIRILIGWCELRKAIRHFRLDRIIAVMPTNLSFPRKGRDLLMEWRKLHGIEE